MNGPGFLPLLLACSVAGALGAGLVLFLQPEPEQHSPPPAADAAMEARIARLEESLTTQEGRLDVLSEQFAGSLLHRSDSDTPTRAEFEQLLARLEELDQDIPIFQDNPKEEGLQAAIEGVLEQRAATEQEMKEERWEQERQMKIDSEAAYLTERLSLTPVQSQDLNSLLEQRSAGRQAIRQAITSGEMSKQDAGEPWMALETAFDEGLSNLLTPVQMEDYRTLQEEK
jgi:uncharacterized coiled-coil protein SlyX